MSDVICANCGYRNKADDPEPDPAVNEVSVQGSLLPVAVAENAAQPQTVQDQPPTHEGV